MEVLKKKQVRHVGGTEKMLVWLRHGKREKQEFWRGKQKPLSAFPKEKSVLQKIVR